MRLVQLRRAHEVRVQHPVGGPQRQDGCHQLAPGADQAHGLPQGPPGERPARLHGQALLERRERPNPQQRARGGQEQEDRLPAPPDEVRADPRRQHRRDHEHALHQSHHPCHGLAAVPVPDPCGAHGPEARGEDALEGAGSQQVRKVPEGRHGAAQRPEGGQACQQNPPPPPRVAQRTEQELASGEPEEVDAHHQLGSGLTHTERPAHRGQGREHGVHAEGPQADEQPEQDLGVDTIPGCADP
ncbi:hypothetical protein HRbin32_00850 [bacterium HR32]|nr:hypothetical protein HRbin32_00850 [bacterium HR32]